MDLKHAGSATRKVLLVVRGGEVLNCFHRLGGGAPGGYVVTESGLRRRSRRSVAYTRDSDSTWILRRKQLNPGNELNPANTACDRTTREARIQTVSGLVKVFGVFCMSEAETDSDRSGEIEF